MRNFAIALVATAALLLVGADAASAAQIIVTTTGQARGIDGGGYFGELGAQIDASYTLTYTFVVTDQTMLTEDNSSDFRESTLYTANDSRSSASFTLNGKSVTLYGTGYASRNLFDSEGAYLDDNTIFDKGMYVGSFYQLPSVKNPKTLSVLSNDVDYVATRDGGRSNGGLSLTNTYLYLSVATVQGGPTDAVPEPAAWAMMVIGFGAVGSIMRRRKMATQAAVASLPSPAVLCSSEC